MTHGCFQVGYEIKSLNLGKNDETKSADLLASLEQTSSNISLIEWTGVKRYLQDRAEVRINKIHENWKTPWGRNGTLDLKCRGKPEKRP